MAEHVSNATYGRGLGFDWRLLAGGGTAIAATALLTALISQYGFAWAPCQLCLWQRWPYMALAIALPIVAAPDRATALLGRAGVAVALGICAAAFFAGAALAVFHSGVEWDWWLGLESCAGAIDTTSSFEQWAAQQSATPPASCNLREAYLFGLSMSNWNFLASAATSGLFGFAALKRLDIR